MKKILYMLCTVLLVFSCTKGPTFLELSTETVVIPIEGGTRIISLNCDGDWTLGMSEGSLWCVPSEMSGSGNTRFSVRAESNIGGKSRKATLTFSVSGLESRKLVVEQEGEDSSSSGGSDKGDFYPVPESGITLDPVKPNADKSCIIKFNPQPSNPLYNFKGEVYGHLGVIVEDEWKFVPCEWGVSDEKVHFTKTADNSWELKLEPSVREYFGSGTTPVTKMAIIVRSEDGELKSHEADQFCSVTDDLYQLEEFVPDPVVNETMPSGVQYGINCSPDGSVTFVFYDKNKFGERSEYCYIVGDWNNWERVPEGAMKRDDAAGCWWITLDGFDQSEEYRYQYRLGKGSGADIRVDDPYTEIVYDQWNDQYLSGIRPYPEGAKGLVSAFRISEDEYQWQHKDFRVEDKNDLIIYELLFRDFSVSKDIAGAMAQMDYLEKLGVNAIELMPIQEFDGNLSWGYNPNHYFALDKAYGTREQYKEFIDECHSRGMAVIVDVVYNHATGSHPWAKMYWNESKSCTSEQNPWFNVTATHPFSVFHDWNHENQMVREHVKRSLGYLLEEYDVDGFRFDLSKGFTQKNSGNDVGAWSAYDASRIAILRDYYDYIQSVNSDAVVILEHLGDAREEKELAEFGAQLWRKVNNEYASALKGSKADFSAAYSTSPFGGYVSYMESHDEQRICYGATGASESSDWGICGSFTGWGEKPDVKMVKEGSFYVSKSVDFPQAAEFKVREGSVWDKGNYGAPGKAMSLKVGESFALYSGPESQNLRVDAAGKYDVYLSPSTAELWLMETGKRPSEPSVSEEDAPLALSMRRAGCCAAFFLTVPGPKMIWQFGELGYDISGGNGDTSEKPVKTQEYLSNKYRKGLYDTYCGLLKFRRENPEFFDKDADFKWYVSNNEWDNGRFIYCTADGKSFAVIGNFSTSDRIITAWLPAAGMWKDYEAFGSGTYNVTVDSEGHNALSFNLRPGEFRLIVKE